MQIYGFLLNIRGIFTENSGKTAENSGISEEFIPQHLAS